MVGGETDTAAAGMGLGRAVGGESGPRVGLLKPAPVWANVVGEELVPFLVCLVGPATESAGGDAGGREGGDAIVDAQAGRSGPLATGGIL